MHWLLVTTLVTHPVQDGHQDDGGGDDDEDGDEERRSDQHDRVGEVFWFGPVRSAAEKVGHVKLGGRITKPCSELGSTTTTCSTAAAPSNNMSYFHWESVQPSKGIFTRDSVSFSTTWHNWSQMLACCIFTCEKYSSHFSYGTSKTICL